MSEWISGHMEDTEEREKEERRGKKRVNKKWIKKEKYFKSP